MDIVHFNAAGGVLVDRDRVLLLRTARYSDLRLPKGHIRDGESPREAALREVAEESGYGDLEIVADLGEQDVEFDIGDRHIIRHEHYFVMCLRSPRQIARPPEDKKFTPEWHPWEDAIAGLVFDEERRWLVRARRLQDTEE
jgi:8-oxo-dGTP pyrophosphatase MutT (NUDIX family)